MKLDAAPAPRGERGDNNFRPAARNERIGGSGGGGGGGSRGASQPAAQNAMAAAFAKLQTKR